MFLTSTTAVTQLFLRCNWRFQWVTERYREDSRGIIFMLYRWFIQVCYQPHLISRKWNQWRKCTIWFCAWLRRNLTRTYSNALNATHGVGFSHYESIEYKRDFRWTKKSLSRTQLNILSLLHLLLPSVKVDRTERILGLPGGEHCRIIPEIIAREWHNFGEGIRTAYILIHAHYK